MRKKNINFIEDYINDCLIEDRIIILNIIVERIGKESFYEENTGIRIMYKKINNSLLLYIKDYITEAIKKTSINLMFYS